MKGVNWYCTAGQLRGGPAVGTAKAKPLPRNAHVPGCCVPRPRLPCPLPRADLPAAPPREKHGPARTSGGGGGEASQWRQARRGNRTLAEKLGGGASKRQRTGGGGGKTPEKGVPRLLGHSGARTPSTCFLPV
jgi:hypothetical protein